MSKDKLVQRQPPSAGRRFDTSHSFLRRMTTAQLVLLLDAGVRGLPGAFVEPGEYRIIDFLALDEVDHD
jgi:hypothetical protein